MDQLKRVAARGYAYVACSRFKTKRGCHLYGKLRVSDFLPVGELQEDEITERGYHSVSSEDEAGQGLEQAWVAGHSRLVGGESNSDDEVIPESDPADLIMHDFGSIE
jgi:hypothetical protein